MVTADHGNSEQMVDEGGNPWTAHTLSPVPLVVLSAESFEGGSEAFGGGDGRNEHNWRSERSVDLDRLGTARLADVAPTLLDLMDLPIPSEFTGRSLLIRSSSADNGKR